MAKLGRRADLELLLGRHDRIGSFRGVRESKVGPVDRRHLDAAAEPTSGKLDDALESLGLVAIDDVNAEAAGVRIDRGGAVERPDALEIAAGEGVTAPTTYRARPGRPSG